MANKINQITIGDMLYIQLDGNPRDTGYQAPMGSSAVYIDTVNNIGRFFHKENISQFGWREIRPWNVFGNQESTNRFLGTLTDFDITFIRNNNEYLKAIKNIDANYDPTTLTFQGGKLSLVRHNIKGDSLNITTILSNKHLIEPVNDTDRENFLIGSQGYLFNYSTLGHYKQQGSRTSDPANEQVYRDQNDNSKARKAMSPSGGICSLICNSLDYSNPDLLMTEVRVLIRRNSDGLLAQLKNTFTIKCDETNKTYVSIFKQDDYTQYEIGMDIPEVNLTFSNQTDTYVSKPLNTCLVTANVSGLNNVETYDVMIWCTDYIMESNI